jgi:transposase
MRDVSVTKFAAAKAASCAGLVGALVGFAAGFKAAETIYADDTERKRVGNTVRLVLVSAGVTVGLVALVRIATAS